MTESARGQVVFALPHELYYNVAVTKWLGVTIDLQIVNPGLKKTLTSSGQLKDVDTAVVGGLRAFVRF